ncbi:hypothetical protein HHUSO_G14773, partial [Huso huso]
LYITLCKYSQHYLITEVCLMTGEIEQVHGVLTRALSSVRQAESELRSHTTDDVDDFDAASFVSETRALFRSRSVDSSQRTGKRGRKKGRQRGHLWKTHFFLLQKNNEEFVPPPSELSRLTRNGLGVPKCEQPATNERYGSKSTVQRSWSLRQLENFVQDSFPDVPLILTGFTFAKAEKGRRLSKLNITSAADLQTKIGKGKIFIVPNHDIPLPIERTEGRMLNESRQVTAGSNASVTQLQVQEQVHIQELSNGNIGTRTSENPIIEDYHQRENEVMQQHATNAMADLLENETSENIPQRAAETEILDIEQLFQADSFENELIAAGQSQFQLSEWTTHPSTPPPLPFSYVNADTPTVQLKDTTYCNVIFVFLPYTAFSELDVLLEEEVTAEVKRHTVLEDVQRIYSNQSIINKRLHVNFIGEEGDDFGGLTKDLFFFFFWNSAFIQWFKGEDALVPCIPVNQYAKAQDIFFCCW